MMTTTNRIKKLEDCFGRLAYVIINKGLANDVLRCFNDDLSEWHETICQSNFSYVYINRTAADFNLTKSVFLDSFDQISTHLPY